MKRVILLALSCVFLSHHLLSQSAAASGSLPLSGIWENKSRFIEFAANDRMRVILKPYYAFVYEDTGWMPYSESAVGESTGSAPANPEGETVSSTSIVNGAGASDAASAPAISFAGSSPSLHSIAVRYAGEKYDQLAPAAIIGDGMFFRFYRKTADSTQAQGDGSASGDASISTALQGYWLASGNADALLIYRSEPVSEFFSYYFVGSRYYRIRYWQADVRYRNVQASFAGPDGKTLSVPKFIPMGGTLYTCVTSTGTTLRNFERGSYSVKDGSVTLKPENVVFAGTAAAVRNALRVSLSADGTVLALGEPYLTRSKVSDLDEEIKKHNGLRRPPRKPIFEFMDLDFHWDEIERIRNNGKAPESK